MKKLGRRAKFLFEQFKKTISVVQKSGDKKLKAVVQKIEDDVNKFLEPKKYKFFKLDKFNQKKKFKKKILATPGTDPAIIARRINGRKGGDKTAALYSKEQRSEWASRAGNTTLQLYGRDYFKHIRSLRKKWPKKHKKRSK